MGGPCVTVDAHGGGAIGEGYSERYSIRKASGKDVETGAFMQPTGIDLSGLLCSRVEASVPPVQLGCDFQLVPNPLARVELPSAFRHNDRFYEEHLSSLLRHALARWWHRYLWQNSPGGHQRWRVAPAAAASATT